MADPHVEECTWKSGMYQDIDMSRFRVILNPQTTKLTIKYRNNPLTNYIIKTTRNTVEYIKIISGKQKKVTRNFDNFNEFNSSPFKIIKKVYRKLSSSNLKAINRWQYTRNIEHAEVHSCYILRSQFNPQVQNLLRRQIVLGSSVIWLHFFKVFWIYPEYKN